jgi:protein LTV1
MGKKQFIDKKNSKTYRLVHRSQRDPLINDENAPRLVLQEVTTGHYLNEEYQDVDENLPNVSEESENDKEDWKNDVSNFGVYFKNDENYDYMQHLKTVGEDPNGIILGSESKKEEIGIRFKDADAKLKMDLPSEVFASAEELNIGLLNQENTPGLSIDMDPEIRDAFEALDDEAYVEDLEDDFFDAFHEEVLPQKYADLTENRNHNEDSDSENMDDWMNEFKKFQKNKNYVVSDDDDDYGADTDDFKPKRKGTSTNFSMTSSSMFRNDKLTLLDNQFDKILEEYSDEEIGQLASDDEDLRGTYTLSGDNQHLEEMFDSFLENLHVRGRRQTVVERKPEENLDALRQELNEHKSEILERYSYVEPLKEMPIVLPGRKKKSEWDAESILTTNSNIYNRPTLIKEISNGAPKIRLKRGIPVVVQPDESSDEDDAFESRANKGSKRNENESKEEKKARKDAIKREKRERREQKKTTKLAFGAEKGRQARQVSNIRLQTHSVQL